MAFTPQSQHARLHCSDSWVAVVARAEGPYQLAHLRDHRGVVPVRREAGPLAALYTVRTAECFSVALAADAECLEELRIVAVRIAGAVELGDAVARTIGIVGYESQHDGCVRVVAKDG